METLRAVDILENALYNFKTFARQNSWEARNPIFITAMEQLENGIGKLLEEEEK